MTLLKEGEEIFQLATCPSQTIQDVEDCCEEIKEFILIDRKGTIQMIMNATHRSYFSVRTINEEDQMSKVSAH